MGGSGARGAEFQKAIYHFYFQLIVAHYKLVKLCQWQKPHSASCTGTTLSKNLRLTSGNISSVQCSPITAFINSLRLPEAFMASLAPLRTSQLCFSPNAASQAAQRMSETSRCGSAASSKVTRMKVRSHIMRKRLRAVELYFLYYLGALRAELLSPLRWCSCFSIQRRMKERKPRCPLNVSLLARMMATLDCTSEKAMPRKELSAAKTRQNWSRMAQKGSMSTSFSMRQASMSVSSCYITKFMSNFSRCPSYFISFIESGRQQSGEDEFLQLLLQVAHHVLLHLVELVQLSQLPVSLLYLLYQLSYFLFFLRGTTQVLVSLHHLRLKLQSPCSSVLSLVQLEGVVTRSPRHPRLPLHVFGVLRESPLLVGAFESDEYLVQKVFDGIGCGCDDVVDLLFGEGDSDSFEDFEREGVPVLHLFGGGVGGGVVVERDQLGTVVVDQLRHHHSV